MEDETKKRREEILRTLVSSPENEKGWHDLFMEFWPIVYAMIYRRLDGDGARAQELSQQVFIRLAKYPPFRKLERPKEFPEVFLGYLARMASNVINDAFRKSDMLQFVGGSETLDLEPASTVDSSREAATARDLILSARDELSESERKLLDLLWEGQSDDEISAALGIKYGNAGVRIHRLKLKMRAMFRKP